MKSILSIVMLSWFSSASFCQQSAEGSWLGTLHAGADLRVVFHINKDVAGLTATMDSPDQGAKGIPVTSVVVTGDSVLIKMEMVRGGFAGSFMNDTTIQGSWSQGPAKLPLTLIKTKNIVELNRPQTPKSPFDYKSEDIEYDNADRSVHFGATLTYPAGGGKYPAIILITGSGQQDRDETIFEHRPFAVIADYLTKQGFAVLRVDDRGKGKSTGGVTNATSADFAEDVETSLAFLKTQKQVDTNRIGLLGHSEGGLIAAMVASRRSDINFMVLLAGPGENGALLLAGQNAALLRSQGIDSLAADAYKHLYFSEVTAIINAKDTSAAFKNAFKSYEKWKNNISQKTLDQLGITSDEIVKADIREKITGLNSPWMKYFLNSNAAKLLEKTNAKVLALNGEKDIQVIAATNLDGIKKALQKSKSTIYETRSLPGLNHLFQHCTACTIAEYGKLEETFSPEALTMIGDWLTENIIGSGSH